MGCTNSTDARSGRVGFSDPRNSVPLPASAIKVPGNLRKELERHNLEFHSQVEHNETSATAQVDDHAIKSSGLDLQVALDSFFNGHSERPLAELLAKEAGKDPSQAQLRITPLSDDGNDLPQSSEHAKITKIEGGFDEVSGAQKKWERLLGHQGQSRTQAKEVGSNGAEAESSMSASKQEPQHEEPQSMSDFQYTPLDAGRRQIRLLVAKDPDSVTGAVKFDLRIYDLEEAPEFFALSYFSGSHELDIGFSCAGKMLRITHDLARALQRVVVPWSRRVPLWAEAICIDHKDLDERNHQVSMMGDIYSRATKLLVHLETSPEQCEGVGSDWSAMSLMSYFNEIWHVDRNNKPRSDEDWYKLGIPSSSDDEVWSIWLEFWLQPWFRRCWTLHEVARSQEVVMFYGNAIKTLSTIEKFVQNAQQHDLPPILKYGHMADAYRMGLKTANIDSIGLTRQKLLVLEGEQSTDTNETKHRQMTLLDLLIWTESSEAADPRDKVYSLLKLAQDDIAQHLVPDYNEENSTAKVYTEVAEAYIRNVNGVALLHHAGIENIEAGYRRIAKLPDPVPDLPSWVPDWSQKLRHHFEHKLYSCARSTKPQIHLTSTKGELKVRGAIIDTVKMESTPLRYSYLGEQSNKFHYYKRMGPTHGFPGSMAEIEVGRLVDTQARLVSTKYCSKEIYGKDLNATLLARTLIADVLHPGRRAAPDDLIPSAVAYQQWAEWADTVPDHDAHGGPARFIQQKGSGEKEDKAWPYVAALQRTQAGRRVCWTERGYIGTATYDTEEGDLIVLFEGFHMPFVLRRKDKNFALWEIATYTGSWMGSCCVELRMWSISSPRSFAWVMMG